MQAEARVFAAAVEFNFADNTISFFEFERIGNSVVEDDQLIPIEDYNSAASNIVLEPLALGEVLTDELKGDLEERLRLRMANHNLCEPHIPLKERQSVVPQSRQ